MHADSCPTTCGDTRWAGIQQLRMLHPSTAARCNIDDGVFEQVAMARRDLALRLRDARRTDRRLETVAQFKQAMTAPDWEMDDYEWRAAFTHWPANQPNAGCSPSLNNGPGCSKKERSSRNPFGFHTPFQRRNASCSSPVLKSMPRVP